jgi:pyrimidine operon attenuation protein/uracil phosphoribosyltransferase
MPSKAAVGDGARVILDAESVDETLQRLAGEIHDRARGDADLVLIGIHRRGVELTDRIASHLESLRSEPVPTGTLDITLYRDDFGQVGPWPIIGTTEINFEITDRRVVIVDDVIHTARTVRAALKELADFGRPQRIELCALVDRGGRELPIQPDYVGITTEVEPGFEVAVCVPEIDGELSVKLVPVETADD